MVVKAFTSGCEGTELSDDERSFFDAHRPWGLILFARNCESREQVSRLVSDFRQTVGRQDAPVLIDQEGGRVRRLRPPEWPAYPACRTIARIADTEIEAAERCSWLHGRLIATDLKDLGISVDCLPVLDVWQNGASEAIGDRSFGDDPQLVARLGQAVADGLAAGGVAPVIKHIPGQGRAVTDSHYDLPVVDLPFETLDESDFAPFKALNHLAGGMTSHVVYSAIDPNAPATTSSVVIRDIIRDRIGFDGLLMSDDISMNALKGTPAERAVAILEAGCDIVLHCNGHMDDMWDVASVVRPLTGRSLERAEVMQAAICAAQPFDKKAGRAEYEALLADVGWSGSV